MTADHRVVYDANTNERKDTKVKELSNYYWWSCNGGIDAMEKEAKKCRPECVSCHRLQTQKDKDRLWNGGRNARWSPDVTNKNAIRRRQNRTDIRKYVADLKCDIGECACCQDYK